MRRHRFHHPDLQSGMCVVTGEQAAHLQNVLRVAEGAQLRAFDGQGNEADGVVRAAEPGRLTVELQEPKASDVEADLEVTAAVALLKGDKLSDVVRRGTELGAVAFKPIISQRSEVRQLSPNKLERLRRVAREAAKQSGRSLIPEVGEALRLTELRWEGKAVVAHPKATMTLSQVELDSVGKLTLITGPEGGFSDEEVESLLARGAVGVQLGRRTLRAETAPVALIAALLVPEAR